MYTVIRGADQNRRHHSTATRNHPPIEPFLSTTSCPRSSRTRARENENSSGLYTHTAHVDVLYGLSGRTVHAFCVGARRAKPYNAWGHVTRNNCCLPLPSSNLSLSFFFSCLKGEERKWGRSKDATPARVRLRGVRDSLSRTSTTMLKFRVCRVGCFGCWLRFRGLEEDTTASA